MKESLINRLSQGELLELWALTQGEQNNHLKEELYQLTLDDNRRVAVNALWVFTHFALADNVWLFTKHDQLVDRAITEQDVTKLRLILTLLLRQPFDEEAIRTDFIDFCLMKLTDPKSPYAIRAQCIFATLCARMSLMNIGDTYSSSLRAGTPLRCPLWCSRRFVR